MQREEKANVKTEEIEFIDIKHEDGIYIEEEEDIETNGDVNIDIKEEVS
jgi:hypothetical protein